MSLRLLSKDELVEIYQRNFAKLQKNVFFTIQNKKDIKKYQIFKVVDLIDNENIQVIEFTSSENLNNNENKLSHYHYNDNDCLNIIQT